MRHKRSERTTNVRGYHLNSRVNWLFIAIIIPYTIILGLFLYFSFMKRVRENVIESAQNVLSSVNSTVTNGFSTVSTMSKLLMFSDESLYYLRQENRPNYTAQYRAVRKTYDIINELHGVDSVYLFREDGEYIHIANGKQPLLHTEMLKDHNWRRLVDESDGMYVIQINGNGLFTCDASQPVISLLRVVNDPETQKRLGILSINLSKLFFDSILKDTNSSEQSLAIVSDDLLWLYGDEEEWQSLKNENHSWDSLRQDDAIIRGSHVICTCQVKAAPLRLCWNQTIRSYYKSYHFPLIVFLLFFQLSIVAFLFIRFFLKRWVTKPIEELVFVMDFSKQGVLRDSGMKTRVLELQALKDSYNHMLSEIKHLIEELVHQEKIVQQAKTEVMLEQLNPHFLYNTLETIGYLSLESPREEIYDAVESLGSFYRFFLSKGEDMVLLSTEIASVQAYLRIQRYRYGDILKVEYRIAHDCEQCLVPKLILQPLVENSLYHGIRPKGEKGTITISAEHSDQMLLLTVEDTGIGVTKEQLEELQNCHGQGFGFQKTMERIKRKYGQRKLFEITSEEGKYFRIKLLLPYERKQIDDKSHDCR